MAKIKSMRSAAIQARKEVKDGMLGKKPAFYTRFHSLNQMTVGGYRYGNNYFIGGPSSHGKSTLLEMLLEDFQNPKLNPKMVDQFKILHFGWDMEASDELLKSITAASDYTYAQLISAFEPITAKDFEYVDKMLEKMAENKIMYFVDEPLNRYDMETIVDDFARKFPNHRLIISVDHMLLAEEVQGEGEVETIAKLARLFIKFRKRYKSLNIMLGQLNDKIESDTRRDPSNPHLHFPIKKDIHGSKQVYHACDGVQVLYCPEKVDMEIYGPDRLQTRGLVALHQLKMRKGELGVTYFKEDFAHSKMEEFRQPPKFDFNPVAE